MNDPSMCDSYEPAKSKHNVPTGQYQEQSQINKKSSAPRHVEGEVELRGRDEGQEDACV